MATGVNQTKRKQVQYRFNLNINKQDEYELHEIIRVLKKKRSFLGVIRDGIHLILDLRQGQTEVLRELFPWIEDRFINQHHAPEFAVTQTSEITHQLDELKRLLLRSGRSIPLPNISEPIVDAEISLTQRLIGEEYDYMPQWNTALSAVLGQGRGLHLEPKIIWYGIRIGKINVEKALKSGALEPEIIAAGLKAGKLPSEMAKYIQKPESGGIKKIDGADVDLALPSFDDIDF